MNNKVIFGVVGVVALIAFKACISSGTSDKNETPTSTETNYENSSSTSSDNIVNCSECGNPYNSSTWEHCPSESCRNKRLQENVQPMGDKLNHY